MNEEFLAALDDDLIQRFRTAVEIGKWPDGRALTDDQRQTCMQAIIVYEQANLPEHERTGYVPPKPTACGDSDDEDTVKWN